RRGPERLVAGLGVKSYLVLLGHMNSGGDVGVTGAGSGPVGAERRGAGGGGAGRGLIRGRGIALAGALACLPWGRGSRCGFARLRRRGRRVTSWIRSRALVSLRELGLASWRCPEGRERSIVAVPDGCSVRSAMTTASP